MIEDIINSKFKCSCGREHKINIKNISVGKNVLNKIPKIINSLTDKKDILLISDQNTYAAAGKQAKSILENNNFQVNELILTGEKVKPNPTNLFKIIKESREKDYLLACGSGTINDLTGFASYKMGKPYSVIATAPSMDGYASSVSSITAEGVKQTYNTAPAEAIIADINVLKEAPFDLIQAGYGDLLGKTTSLMDWRLANILFNEYYCTKAVRTIEIELIKIINLANQGSIRSPESIEALIKGLIYSGIAMQMVGSSRPASGSEHHVSHFLEMFGDNSNYKMPRHGIKVGMATLFTTYFYHKLYKLDFEKIDLSLEKKKREKDIKNIYKDRSKQILKNLNERWEQEKITKEELLAKEKEIKDFIEEHLELIEKSREILSNQGYIFKEHINNLPKDILRDALRFGFEIRARYTITTLLNQIDLLDSSINEVMAKIRD